MRTAFIEALCQVAAQDERIWLLTGDLGYGVLEAFATKFPDRYLNVGVAEQNMTGLAAGLALSGKLVFTYSIANFPILRCLEQVRNDICYHKANVKIVAVGGGLTYGSHGYTHHAVEDLAIMRTLPGLTVVAPGDPVETRLAVEALVKMDGPAYLRLGKAGEPVVHQTSPAFQLGKGIVVRAGSDVTLISCGATLPLIARAAEMLAEQGIQAAVISLPTLKPLDTELIMQAAQETGWLVTVEEHTVIGGLGGAVAEVLADVGGTNARLTRLGLNDTIIKVAGSQDYLREQAGISPQQIVQTVLNQRVGATTR